MRWSTVERDCRGRYRPLHPVGWSPPLANRGHSGVIIAHEPWQTNEKGRPIPSTRRPMVMCVRCFAVDYPLDDGPWCLGSCLALPRLSETTSTLSWEVTPTGVVSRRTPEASGTRGDTCPAVSGAV